MLIANYGKVIVSVVKNPSVSPGGVLLPDVSVEQSGTGVVVDAFTENVEFEPGTVVHFVPYVGNEIVIDEERFLVLNEDDVLAYESLDEDEDEETDV